MTIQQSAIATPPRLSGIVLPMPCPQAQLLGNSLASPTTGIICKQFPNVKVPVLSTFDDDQYIAESIWAAAKGYLSKDMPAEELVQAIRLAHQGYADL